MSKHRKSREVSYNRSRAGTSFHPFREIILGPFCGIYLCLSQYKSSLNRRQVQIKDIYRYCTSRYCTSRYRTNRYCTNTSLISVSETFNLQNISLLTFDVTHLTPNNFISFILNLSMVADFEGVQLISGND